MVNEKTEWVGEVYQSIENNLRVIAAFYSELRDIRIEWHSSERGAGLAAYRHGTPVISLNLRGRLSELRQLFFHELAHFTSGHVDPAHDEIGDMAVDEVIERSDVSTARLAADERIDVSEFHAARESVADSGSDSLAADFEQRAGKSFLAALGLDATK